MCRLSISINKVTCDLGVTLAKVLSSGVIPELVPFSSSRYAGHLPFVVALAFALVENCGLLIITKLAACSLAIGVGVADFSPSKGCGRAVPLQGRGWCIRRSASDEAPDCE